MPENLKKGRKSEKHIENIQNCYKLPLVVAINKFVTDTDEEIKMIEDFGAKYGVEVSLCEVWAKVEKVELTLQKKL